MSDYTVDFSNSTCEFLEGLIPTIKYEGISRRDYFAAMAMLGLLIRGHSRDTEKQSVLCADALIAELDKKDKSE